MSSNGHYTIGSASNNNYKAYGYGTCSHTECTGKDDGYETAVNIRLNGQNYFNHNDGNEQQLTIPYGEGRDDNWKFQKTFPPYVIFGRMGANCGIELPTLGHDHDTVGTASEAAHGRHREKTLAKVG